MTVIGPQGSVGADGFQGKFGPRGAQGSFGVQGDRGYDGKTGSDGAQGPNGPQGSIGFRADVSLIAGSQGPAGTARDGAQGFRGAQGAIGNTTTGVAGAQGGIGTTGAQGTSAPLARLGAQGAQGSSFPGAQGSQGPPSAAGGSIRSATVSGSYPTATTVITDGAIATNSVVIARFVSSANVVTIQTVLPAAGSFTVTTDTAPSTGVLEYISYKPSAALLLAGVVVGTGAYGGGSATFDISDSNITAGMVVNTNFQSQVTPSKVYTATAGSGKITFVCSANPGVCIIEYVAMLPGDISAFGLHAANYTYLGGFASIVITDASITSTSVVTAEFKSQFVVALIQKVTPSTGTLTILASIDPGPSILAYIATAAPGTVNGGTGNNGAQGQIGAQGYPGAQIAGAQGPQGNIGLNGALGPQGYTGRSGANGPQGFVGPQGYAAAIGPQGFAQSLVRERHITATGSLPLDIQPNMLILSPNLGAGDYNVTFKAAMQSTVPILNEVRIIADASIQASQYVAIALGSGASSGATSFEIAIRCTLSDTANIIVVAESFPAGSTVTDRELIAVRI